MTVKRFSAVFRFDVTDHLKRPLLWIWVVLSLLTAMVMAAGVFTIRSGEDMAGGIQAHITSQFGNAYEMSLFVAILFPLFVAVVSGMGVLRDGELRIEQLLHSTPLRPSEYVWGKFTAAIAISLAALLVMVCSLMLFKHGMTAPTGQSWSATSF